MSGTSSSQRMAPQATNLIVHNARAASGLHCRQAFCERDLAGRVVGIGGSPAISHWVRTIDVDANLNLNLFAWLYWPQRAAVRRVPASRSNAVVYLFLLSKDGEPKRHLPS